MIYIQIALTLGYFAFLTWLILLTWANFVLKPLKAASWSASKAVLYVYAFLWGLALTAPVAYGLILEAVGV